MLNFTRPDLADLTESQYSPFLHSLQAAAARKTSLLPGINLERDSSHGGGGGNPPADVQPGKGGGKEGMAKRTGKTDTYIMHANNLLY